MADERGATVIGGVETEVRALRQDVTKVEVEVRALRQDVTKVEVEVRALRQDVTELKVSVGRLETGFDQMDKRMATLERLSQWTLGIVLTTWITTMLAIITMSFTILSRLR
mgnify:CR=1 FL=1